MADCEPGAHLNRPHQALTTLEQFHATDLPGYVKRHVFFIRSYGRLAQAFHMVDDHESELAAATPVAPNFPPITT